MSLLGWNVLDVNSAGFVSHTDSTGVQTVVAQQWLGRIDELQRSITAGAATTVESLLYVYNGSGENNNLLSSVTYRRKVGNGDWVNVRVRQTPSSIRVADLA